MYLISNVLRILFLPSIWLRLLSFISFIFGDLPISTFFNNFIQRTDDRCISKFRCVNFWTLLLFFSYYISLLSAWHWHVPTGSSLTRMKTSGSTGTSGYLTASHDVWTMWQVCCAETSGNTSSLRVTSLCHFTELGLGKSMMILSHRLVSGGGCLDSLSRSGGRIEWSWMMTVTSIVQPRVPTLTRVR